MKLQRKIVTLATLGLAFSAAAVPAKREVRTVTQPDGTTIEVRIVGDEYLHYMVTNDGNIVSRDTDGRYCYAKVATDGRIISTGISVTKKDAPDLDVTNLSDINTSELRAQRIQARNAAVKPQRLNAPARSNGDPSSGIGRFTDFPANGEVRALVLLVQYKDVKFTLSDPKTYFDDMLNKDGFNQYGGTGCAAEYFRESSNGQFRPIFDVYGPVTLGQNRSYYGGNDYYGNDVQPHLMVTHALAALKDQVDLSKYDADNDGYVDNVYVFYAGQGEASYGSEETVWPHSAHINDFGVTYSANGKQVNRYATSNEWEQTRPDGVGTFIHEFSHVLGLPDLYCTNYNSVAGDITPNAWSVLDYGPYNNDGRTPPTYSVYERNAMGWIDLKELKDAETVALNHIEGSNEGCIIHTYGTTGAVNPNEFFLLENRQQKGWDKYLPGHGMLIWHIDYKTSVFQNNTVNNTTHQYVDIEEACGTANSRNESVLAGYTFPGTSKNTSFTSETTPALKTWAGVGVDVPITNIEEDGSIISFDVCGGGTPVPAPVALAPTEKSSDSFVANWQPVEGATDYRLTVWAVGEGAPKTETADFGTSSTTATFPDGWSSNVNGVYTTAASCGKDAPSLKLNQDGAYLATRTFPNPIKSVSLWLKGQTATSDCTLSIERQDGEGWSTFKTIAVNTYNNKGAAVTIDEIPANTFALRIYYNKGQRGNVAIDDVAVTYGASTYILDGYDAVSTAGATSMRIAAVKSVNKYRYSVRAYVGTSRSAMSNTIELTLSNGVEDVSMDDANAPVEYFNLQGVKVGADNLTHGIYVRRQGRSVSKIVIR